MVSFYKYFFKSVNKTKKVRQKNKKINWVMTLILSGDIWYVYRKENKIKIFFKWNLKNFTEWSIFVLFAFTCLLICFETDGLLFIILQSLMFIENAKKRTMGVFNPFKIQIKKFTMIWSEKIQIDHFIYHLSNFCLHLCVFRFVRKKIWFFVLTEISMG